MITYSEGFNFSPIAIVESPFTNKYGVPRQPSLAIAAMGKIKFKNDPDLTTALKTLEQFSHLWVIFVFHEHGGKNWKPSIRPPRLGGKEKVGVLASRSPHRPNPIGMSVVKIESIDLSTKSGAEIVISGLDLLNGTPVLDVKPYIPYADIVTDATSGWASAEIKKYPIELSKEAQISLISLSELNPSFKLLMLQVLEIDPRPAFQKRENPIEAEASEGLRYGIEIMGIEIKYQIFNQGLLVLSLQETK